MDHKTLIRRLFALALLFAAVVAPAQAQHRDFSGTLGEAGYFRIVVPEGWQDGDALLVWNHGFSMSPVEAEPFRAVAPDQAVFDYWLAQGYALAAGSYRARGWALFDIEADQRALLAEFRAAVGDPGEILLVGGSLGGLVSLKTAGAFVADGEPLAGVYALCPPVAGARTWDQAFELKLAYDAVCAGVGGGEFDRGAEPLGWLIDLDDIPEDLGDFLGEEAREEVLRAAARINQCTGVLLPPALRTGNQRERLDTLMEAFAISSEDFFLANMAYAVFALADLVRAPEKLDGRNPFDSRPVWRSALEREVESVALDPMARFDLRIASNPRGPWGQARVLVTHTSRDELVVPEHLSQLPRLGLEPERLASAIVNETSAGHCAYSGAEFLAGFTALRAWIDGGAQPDAEVLNTHCAAVNALSGRSDRCGYDAALQPGDYDARVRAPWVIDELADTPGLSGVWWDPERSGEGFLIEKLSPDTAALTWFTYPSATDPEVGAGQRWLGGVGHITENGLIVDEVFAWRGGGFGSGFDPAQVEAETWGRIELAIGECGDAALRYAGPEADGSGEQRLRLLSFVGSGLYECDGLEFSPPLPRSPFRPYSGSWYRGPGQGGEGLFLQAQDGGPVVGVWYTFDAEGRPVHLSGAGRAEGDALVLDLFITRGAAFGEAFDPAAVERLPWGTVTLQFQDCNHARLVYQPQLPGWEAGELDYVRLTTPAEIGSCVTP